MKNLFTVLLLISSSPIIAQYNIITNVKANSNVYDRIRELNAIKITPSDAYRVSVAPEFTIFQSAFKEMGGYWRGLALTQNSMDRRFTSTYFYDMQGNLVETKSYFNIIKKGKQSPRVSFQVLPSGQFLSTGP